MVAIAGDGSPVDMGAIMQFLQELRIDTETLTAITEALQEGKDLATYDPAQVPEVRFGTLSNGAALGHHTELARRAVKEALVTMVHDLQHYSDGVETFRKGFNVADEHAQADMNRINAEVGSVRSATEGGLDR